MDDLLRRIKFTLLTLIMEPRRYEKLACMIRGAVDGMRGAMGPFRLARELPRANPDSVGSTVA
jgi:hypothetical protein